MATVSQYIKAKLGQFGFEAEDVIVEVACLKFDLSPFVVVDKSNQENVAKTLASLIPDLLAIPNLSDSGYSKSMNVEGIKSYYKILCAEYGIEDRLQPTIRDASSRW